MEVEHLWQYNEGETPNIRTNTNNPDFLSNLCNIADHRLYKIVKWCKSLPLFKNISVRGTFNFRDWHCSFVTERLCFTD